MSRIKKKQSEHVLAIEPEDEPVRISGRRFEHLLQRLVGLASCLGKGAIKEHRWVHSPVRFQVGRQTIALQMAQNRSERHIALLALHCVWKSPGWIGWGTRISFLSKGNIKRADDERKWTMQKRCQFLDTIAVLRNIISLKGKTKWLAWQDKLRTCTAWPLASRAAMPWATLGFSATFNTRTRPAIAHIHQMSKL